ncbi:ArsR/SmtB family transcription factor [Curtobacterium flaccumfaciens]|uniref:ArsR/SmtB family transcription factor n=1 Tax=Curtobacterium flaccumfaciens TaxID=2035 RepID=UPI001BDF6625|nr:helix-turn-helix domain-containing protein [Curtobacterium flaccumfaciens]MBT1631556.1 helix-turn-helix domain-containing protein [Curtobacterium flaccumfaciens pv. oortii]MCS5524739.1 helix-turn-helix domain-containing protein [Curtobacterium flaccumfaciens pv. oortii]MCX2846865.1 helix-turn-helix domain-containing protein [Curtobacterium flaccumfaciens pv. oortii]
MARALPDDEPEVSALRFSKVIEAIADPIRLSIVSQLAASGKDMSCGAIQLPIAASTATHHFTALRQAGLIRQYYVGTSRMNTLRMEDIESAFPGFLPAVITSARRLNS